MKANNAKADRREYPRFAKLLELALKTPDGTDVVARSINLSRNGAYCEVNAPIPVMTALSVRIELPGPVRTKAAACVECRGVVVRSEKRPANDRNRYNIAIFFNFITQAAMAKFAQCFEPTGRSPAGTALRLPLDD